MQWTMIALVGAGVGLASGLFGKGGASVATPLLVAVGVPPIIAVASPLPATIPSTLAALSAYRQHGGVDAKVVRWSLAIGVPASVLGALLTTWIDGAALVWTTEVLLVLIGLRLALTARRPAPAVEVPAAATPLRLSLVAGGVGIISGLLASSGGFLLAPLYLVALRLPIKRAFASSLAVASVLAIPGTIVHAMLGHIDWRVVLVFGAASIPLSFLGARLAVVSRPARLQAGYGLVLATLGGIFLGSR